VIISNVHSYYERANKKKEKITTNSYYISDESEKLSVSSETNTECQGVSSRGNSKIYAYTIRRRYKEKKIIPELRSPIT